MPHLAPVPADRVDPRIARHLEPGETVLWQGAPRPGTFAGTGTRLLGVALIVGGLALLLGIFDRVLFLEVGLTHPSRLTPSLGLIGMGALAIAIIHRRRDALWAYAITDRRLLSSCGDKLRRAARPEDIARFDTRGDIAYWRLLVPTDYEGNRDPERRYPGFHGLDDAEDMRRTLEGWREDFSEQAEAAAAAYRAAVADGGDLSEAGATRVRHAGTGLTLDVPAGWTITTRTDRAGITIGGQTYFKALIRHGEETPYRDRTDWSTLTVRGAPDAGVSLTIRDGPLRKTLDQIENDPWAKRFGLTTLRTTPDLTVGPFQGFSIVRQMPAGANLLAFGKVAEPVATRQVWLSDGRIHIEFTGMARLDQPDVQHAVDAIVDSLRVS